MVKKAISMILRLPIQTSATIEKKTYTKLDDYADEKGISLVNLTNKIFLKKLTEHLGEKKFKQLLKTKWNTIKIELGKDEEKVSSLLEEGINEVVDGE